MTRPTIRTTAAALTALIGLCASPPSRAAIAYVQTSYGVHDSTGWTTVTTSAKTVTAGNLIVVAVDWNGCATNPTISDLATNTWTYVAETACNNPFYETTVYYYSKNSKAYTNNTITATWGDTINYPVIVSSEYSGADYTAPYVSTGEAEDANPTATTSSFTSTDTGYLAVALGVSLGCCTYTFTAGSGYTLRLGGSASAAAVEDKIGSGTTTAAMTINGTSDPFDLIAATFKPGPASALRMESFSAVPQAQGGSALRWTTGMEVDNLGFNIYREEGGVRTKLTPSLVAGSALFAGPGAALVTGNSYSWPDESSPASSAIYWLEEVDLAGNSVWHGPVAPTAGAGLNVDRRAPLLHEVGVAAPREAVATRRTTRRALSGEVLAKLYVRDEGWQRVSFAELAQAGFTVATPSSLSLSLDGQELPLLVRDDGVEFYGTSPDSPFTDERAYWLSSAGQALRLGALSAAGSVAQQAQARSFAHVASRADKTLYFAALKNGDAENFFGPIVSTKPVEQPVLVERLATPDAELEVSLQGVSLAAHQVEVLFNGAVAGVASFDGQERATMRAPVAALEGNNVVTLVARGEGTDVSLVDTVRLSYARKYEAVGDALRFTVAGGQTVKVLGFSRSDIRVVDITEPSAPVEVTGAVAQEGNGFVLKLGATAKSRTLLALPATAAQKPGRIEARPLPGLKPTGAAFVILSHADFVDAMAPLAALRESQGLTVQVVDAEDAYDTYGNGQKSVGALKAFLKAAYEAGTRYALLVGDASFDAKNHLGFGNFDFLPTGTVESEFLETASDDLLTDFDGDGVPELMVGRLPVRTAEQAAAVVAKVERYRPQPASLVALTGPTGDSNFSLANESLISAIPDGVRVDQLDSDELGVAAARDRLLAQLHDGVAVVEYLGHGSTQKWANGILSTDDAPALKVDSLPLFLSLTCLSAYFHDVYTESLAEVLLKAPESGAIATYATSALSGPAEQVRMGKEFLSHLYARSSTLGEAALAAKVSQRDDRYRGTWMLLGDPTLQLVVGDPVAPGPEGCGCGTGGAAELIGLGLLLAVFLALRQGHRVFTCT